MNVCPRERYYDRVYFVSAILNLSHGGQQSLPISRAKNGVLGQKQNIFRTEIMDNLYIIYEVALKKKNDVFSVYGN